MVKRTEMDWDVPSYLASYRDAIGVIDIAINPFILPKVNLKRGDTVLECGIGSGKWTAAFALLGFNVYAMDNLKNRILGAYRNFPNICFQGIEKDIRDPPLMDKPVDLLFNEGVIEHFLDDEERRGVLSNFYEAVKGYVSIIVPYKNFLPEFEIYYTKKKLRDELKEVGFSILDDYCVSFRSGDKVTIKELIGVNAQKSD